MRNHIEHRHVDFNHKERRLLVLATLTLATLEITNMTFFTHAWSKKRTQLIVAMTVGDIRDAGTQNDHIQL